MKPRRLTSLIVAAGTALAAARAQSAPPDPVAQSLFDQGRAELACAKLEESQRLSPAPGTAFNLADCYAHIGKLASAWSLFRDVEAASNLAVQVARARLAKQRADELEAQLPRLMVQVGSAGADLQVQRDGVSLGRAQWDTLVPVDLGEHVVTVSAPHRRPWRTVVAVTRPAEILVVHVPELEPESNAAGPPAIAAPSVPVAAPAVAPVAALAVAPAAPAAAVVVAPQHSAPETPSRVLPIAVGVAGLGLLATSGMTIVVARSSYRDAGPCDGQDCHTQQAVDQRNDARRWGNVATVLGVAGAVGVSTAAILWLLPPRRASDQAAAAAGASWDVALRPDGVIWRGTW
jgi:hypothetical protein